MDVISYHLQMTSIRTFLDFRVQVREAISGADGLLPLKSRSSQAMPETVGAKDEVSSVNSSAHVVQGNMISTEL